MACCSVVWFADWLVGWLIDWLVDWLLYSGTSWKLAWRYCDYFTQWFHRTQVQRWTLWKGHPGVSGHRKFEGLVIVMGHWGVTTEPTPMIFHKLVEKWYRSISELRNCWFFTCIRVKQLTERKFYKLLSRSVFGFILSYQWEYWYTSQHSQSEKLNSSQRPNSLKNQAF